MKHLILKMGRKKYLLVSLVLLLLVAAALLPVGITSAKYTYKWTDNVSVTIEKSASPASYAEEINDDEQSQQLHNPIIKLPEKDSNTESSKTALNSDGSYTVQEGDTFSEIAEKCNTTAELLAAYNGIEDINMIKEGTVLKLPPEGYEIPSDKASVSDETNVSETESKEKSQDNSELNENIQTTTSASDPCVTNEVDNIGAEENNQ